MQESVKDYSKITPIKQLAEQYSKFGMGTLYRVVKGGPKNIAHCRKNAVDLSPKPTNIRSKEQINPESEREMKSKL